MSSDSLIANSGRLKILASLAEIPSQQFVQLRSATRLTDGNLSSHARRLHQAGLLAIDKAFHSGKPVTTITLTRQGREALESHVRKLSNVLSGPAPVVEVAAGQSSEEAWID